MTQSIENQLVTILNNAKTSNIIEDFEMLNITKEWMDDDQKEFTIGFAYNTMKCWHWFTLKIHGEDHHISFRETYSRTTGTSKKGFHHGFKVRESINKKLGTQIF